MADFVSLSRGTGPNTQQELVAPAEHLADARQAQHPRRPRRALDQRLQRQLRQRRRVPQLQPAVHPQHHQQHQRARRQLVRVVPARRARPTAKCPVNVFPHYQWFFIAPWIQDDWRVSDKLTINLGFRWDGNGSVREEENRLNYAFDPTLTNPVSAQVGQPVIGGMRFVGVDGAPETPWKFDKNNFQLRAGMAYSINEKTVVRGGYGKYYLNPTAQSFNNGFSLATPVIASNDGNRTPTYALGNPWPNGDPGAPGQLARAADVPRPQPGFSNPDFVVPNVAPVLGRRPARAAVGRRARGELRRQPQQRHAVGWNGFNEPSAEFQRQCDVTLGGSRSVLRPARCPTRSSGCPGSRARTGSPARRSRASSWRVRSRRSRLRTGSRSPTGNCMNMTERNDGTHGPTTRCSSSPTSAGPRASR